MLRQMVHKEPDTQGDLAVPHHRAQVNAVMPPFRQERHEIARLHQRVRDKGKLPCDTVACLRNFQACQRGTPYRMQAEDLGRYYVRNAKGEMVPFSSFVTKYSTQGSPRLERYGGVSSIEILGEPAAGYSSGQAMEAMEGFMKELPAGFGYSWTSISYQEKLSGSQAPLLYAVSIVVVFLCLAALYESWSVPLSVLLVVPFGVMGALAGIMFRDMNNDIYFQIGILTVIGLAAKNSILIVEFAKDMHEKGHNLYQSVVRAARLRLRPIIMTSLCFILGVIPLMISSGAGAGGQNALGTTVVFGVLTATCLGIYFTPVFFVVVTALFTRKRAQGPGKVEAPAQAIEGGSHA